jgi:CheY-like chemotaxis protein
VRQILTFSRQTPSKREALHATEIVAEAVNFLRATAPSSIQIRHLAAENAPCIEADPTQLHQIIVNLCTNALHAMRGMNGQLDVTEELVDVTPDIVALHPQLRIGRFLRISVRDTGCGMPREVMQRIFEPFFTTKAPGEGTGLGLSVVHGIMQAHGGAITVYSEPGRGTEFRIHFPITGAPDAHAGDGPLREIPHGSGERVLYVDDEPVIVRLAETTLRRLGYTPLCFTRPQDAATTFAENPGAFDIVISDLTMPGMNGIELARHIHALRPRLPVIIASGYVGDREAEAAAQACVTTLLPKPLSTVAIAEALHAALSQARAGDTPPPAQAP